MRSIFLTASLAASVMVGSSALAQATSYSAADLLSPCQEADNDARWGAAAEAECEQYIMGFVGALRAIGEKESSGICAPDQNTADEVRWAFMRWVHASYSQRTKMPANEALFETLKENFACN